MNKKVQPIHRYVIESLIEENKLTAEVLLATVKQFTNPNDFCMNSLQILIVQLL